MASTAVSEAGRTQIYGSPQALSMFREKPPGKDQSWSKNLILLPMLRSVSPAARSPRSSVRDFSPLNFTQVGMVAVSAIRLKRQTLPLGINEWSEDVIQEKLLEVVTRANVDVQVISSKLLCVQTKHFSCADSCGLHGAPSRGNQLCDKSSEPRPGEKVAAVVTFGASVH